MPSAETRAVAERFVDLVLKYDWSIVEDFLPSNEMQVLSDTLSAAGFESKRVARGKLVGRYRDQDDSSTGETYPVNDLCPFHIIGEDGQSDYGTTGWLDCALKRVLTDKFRIFDGTRVILIEKISYEIERSVPLQPILLTPAGDYLVEYHPSTQTNYLVDHTRDNNKLECCVGVHKYCDSWMDRKHATRTHDALVCRGCYIRVLFPKEVKTYRELRQALAQP